MSEVEAAHVTDYHPLLPLSADEMRQAAAIVRRDHPSGGSVKFIYIALHEPDKSALMEWEARGERVRLPRRVFVSAYDPDGRMVSETLVSLDDDSVSDFREVPGASPSLLINDIPEFEEAMKSDPRFIEAMRRRGITDLTQVVVEPWSAGGPDDVTRSRGTRLVRPLCLMPNAVSDNSYAKPVANLTALFDMDTMTLLELNDFGPIEPSGLDGGYIPDALRSETNWPSISQLREDVRPLEVIQPEGPSFTVDGNAIRWQGWQLRVGCTPREGLVLHQLSYEDKGQVRPIIHRAAVSELYIPYGDTTPSQAFKNVFDEGEVGLGLLFESLALGCDCLGEIRYMDAIINDSNGEPVVVSNAVCIHEEDAGIGWKHRDWRNTAGGHAVRRMRRLVVSSIYLAGNYIYGTYWYLYQDGSIECDMQLGGIVTATGIEAGEAPRHGSMVAPGLYAPHHQHFFCVRMEMAVDGARNSVYEVDSKLVEMGPDNPHGTAWEPCYKLLASESEGSSVVNSDVGRYWLIANPNVENKFGGNVAYKLEPGTNVSPMAAADSFQGRRGAFTRRHLWVTAHDRTQRYAAGDYPFQQPGPDGLPRYVLADRPLENTDLVLWYVFGAHHIVRPEDWPVMPTLHIGFHLKPVGFFDYNPAIDLPEPTPHCQHEPAGVGGHA